MDIVGFENKDKTFHRTLPVKHLRYVEATGEKDNKKFFIKLLGSKKRVEVDKKTADTIIEAMTNG